MLASQGKSSKSTVTSSRGGSTSTVKKDGFFVYVYKRLASLFSNMWSHSRRFLFVSSTAFILLILPFTFAYITEYQKEAIKIMGAHQGNIY